MHLIESEIRKIVRKNLINYYQDQLLNEQVLSSSTNLKYLAMQKSVKDEEGKETQVEVPSLKVKGVDGVLVGTDSDTQKIKQATYFLEVIVVKVLARLTNLT